MLRTLKERTIRYNGALNAEQFRAVLQLCDLPVERHKPGADQYVFTTPRLCEPPIYAEVCETLVACGGAVTAEEVYEIH